MVVVRFAALIFMNKIGIELELVIMADEFSKIIAAEAIIGDYSCSTFMCGQLLDLLREINDQRISSALTKAEDKKGVVW